MPAKIQFYLNNQEVFPSNLIERDTTTGQAFSNLEIQLIGNGAFNEDESFMFQPIITGNVDTIIINNVDNNAGFDLVREQFERNPYEGMWFTARSSLASGIEIYGQGDAVAHFVNPENSIENGSFTLKIEDRRVSFQKELDALSLRNLYLQDKKIDLVDAIKVGYVLETSIDNDKEYLSPNDQRLIREFSFLIFDAQKDIATALDSFTKKTTDAGHFLGTSQAISAFQLVAEISKVVLVIETYRQKLRAFYKEAFRALRYYHGVKIRKLLETIALEFDLIFESTVFDTNKCLNEQVILPRKDFAGTLNKNGFSQEDKDGGFIPYQSASWLMSYVSKITKGKFKIENNKLRFETLNTYYNEFSNIQPLQRIREKDDNSVLPYTVNTFENERYELIQFQKDETDENTLINTDYFGQQSYTPQPANDAKLNMMRGVQEINLPVTRAHRKEFETNLGVLIRRAINLINRIGSFMGLSSRNVASQPVKRTEYMKLSRDGFNVPKILIPKNESFGTIQDYKAGKKPSNYSTLQEYKQDLLEGNVAIPDEISLYKFLELRNNWTPIENNFEIIESFDAPISESDLIELRNKAICYDQYGNKMVIIEATYNPEKDLVTINARRFADYFDNFSIFRNVQ